MANVILKDLNGNETEYSGVTQIEVPVTNTAGELVAHKFTSLLSLKAYAIEKANAVDGVAYWKILDQFSWIPSEHCLQFALTDAEYQSYGGDGVTCFVTPKALTVGNAYPITDMY